MRAERKTRLRSVFISDVHLGSRDSRAGELLQFLASVEVDYLFLVGDIIDFWSLRKNFYWPQQHNEVLRAILGKAREGARVIYVPGNHDNDMREFCGSVFGNLEIRRLGEWSRTGIKEARRMVIKEANAWAEFWSELGVGDRPAVDFTRDVVIVVAAGERPSGGYEIAVSQVTQTNGELRVEVRETSPGPNCLSSSSLSQPVDVVVVQGVKPKSWSFVEQKDVRGCSP